MLLIENTTHISYEYIEEGVILPRIEPELSITQKGVYILYNKNKECIYIGQGTLRSRIMAHCKNDKKEWKYCQVFHIGNKNHRLIFESLLIKYLKPKLNKSKPYVPDTALRINPKKVMKVYLEISSLKTQLYDMIDLYDINDFS